MTATKRILGGDSNRMLLGARPAPRPDDGEGKVGSL